VDGVVGRSRIELVDLAVSRFGTLDFTDLELPWPGFAGADGRSFDSDSVGGICSSHDPV